MAGSVAGAAFEVDRRCEPWVSMLEPPFTARMTVVVMTTVTVLMN
jgi:hypothetical protein